mmetsp:Transcript_17581/g.42909  ORF Transcript_17581/g.42909 Transcript_17581/m.42909 type:complete len:182 (+) Transcript_17581:73-618(+)|eukprot:CAMPEP_0114524820 /NCGR_PEP_ID=MMETSP0109-20121206/22070_1 /TAXON_ID=29199 /ORGANISM="Chlorarachnion reptans, Strain CCCM449" /LENGTH=181 /DNA_ID=CAMNT_0001706311 /DNA_START=30 /DNA_END=575 /DNA_ORIENTATION=-
MSSSASSDVRQRFSKRKWTFEEDPVGAGGTSTMKVQAPIGYIAGDFKGTGDESNVRRIEMDEKIKQSAMAMATSPGKQILMTGVMMFMTGNTLQIFSIMMLGMAMWTPISGLLNTGKVFERYENRGVDLVMPKLIYVALNLAGFALVCWKLNSMGLMPAAWELGAVPELRMQMDFAAGSSI